MSNEYNLEEIYKQISDLDQRVRSLEFQLGKETSTFNSNIFERAQLDQQKEVNKSCQEKAPVVETTVNTEVVSISQSTSPTSENVNEPIAKVESKIGKNIMSILASVLIFCSVVLFGNMINSILTPVIKTVLMLVASVATAIFGLIKMKKEGKYKSLFTAIAGCGAGAFYVSCIVAYFILETFNDVCLMVSIGVWIAALIALSKYYSKIFTYVSYAGIIVATIISFYNWDTNTTIALTIYLLSTTALYIANFTHQYSKDWWLFLQLPIMNCFLISGYNISEAIMVITPAVLVFQALFYNYDEKDISKLTFLSPLYLIVVKFASVYSNTTTSNIFFLISSIAICYVFFRRFYTDNKKTFNTVFIASSILMTFTTIDIRIYDDIQFILIPTLVLIVGCLLRDTSIRMTGYILLMFNVFNVLNDSEYLKVSDFYIAILVFAMIPWIKRNYNYMDKLMVMLLLIIEIINLSFRGPIDNATTYALIGIVCLLLNMPFMRRNIITHEKETVVRNIGYIFNAIMITTGICVVSSFEGKFVFFTTISNTPDIAVSLASCILLGLACINVKSLMKIKEQEDIMGYLNCLKLTIVTFFILSRFCDVNYVISIVGLLMAIGFIIGGFHYKTKSFRLYGLILSMICVVKLVLSDVKYDSSVMRPIGFLIAGILCFTISWIYSRLEKKQNQ